MNGTRSSFVRGSKAVFYLMLIALVSCVGNPSTNFNLEQMAIFEKYTDQGVQLYSWSAENDGFQNILTLDLNERYILSPDASQVAIYFTDELRVINLITFTETSLSKNLTWPTVFIENIEHTMISWSPNGDKLAVLTGGPSWEDESISSTSLLIFDVMESSLEAIINNGTWINNMVWSPDSKMILFAELQTPCWFTEICKETDEATSWGLTMAVQLESGEWQVQESKSLTLPISGYAWQEGSVCQLSWSPLGTFISYEAPCNLNELPHTRNIFAIATDMSTSIQRIGQNQNSLDARYFDMHWLVEKNELIVAFRGDSFGEDKHSISSLSRYSENNSRITLVNEEIIDEVNLSIPLTIDYSPDNLYAISKLVNDNIMVIQLSDLSTEFLQNVSDISFNGTWISEGYLTQSKDRIILIQPKTAQWGIIRDELPNDIYLIGWQDVKN